LTQQYLTEHEAAHLAKVSAKYLRKLRCVGGGPIYIKAGRRVVYDVADVQDWLQSQKVRSTSDHAASQHAG
jgi:hypothetical protein